MKVLNPKFHRKDPLNPILGAKGKDYEFKSYSNIKKSYDLGSSNLNSSFFKNTMNNSTNRISSNRQISTFSDIITENKKTSYTNNNITLSSDNLLSCLNSNNNCTKRPKSKSMPRKKKVRFPDNDKFVQVILVESHKKFLKLDDDIFYDNQKDIDKIKVLKSEIKKKENNVDNNNNNNNGINNKEDKNHTKRKDVSPIKAKDEKIKEKKKDTCNNNNKNYKPYDDKACKCIIF